MHRAVILLSVGILVIAAAPVPTRSEEFSQEMDTAMNRMMPAMHSRPSDTVDRQFVDMMIPHHQGAIDMAVAELRYGSNPQLRRMAQEIIVEQQQQIAAMRLALGDPLTPATPGPTQQAKTGHHQEH
jgi:uncharacterized protein (DUF305 family)